MENADLAHRNPVSYSVDNFYIIYHLVKERGFTLQGAKAKLKQNKSDTIDTVEIVKSLTKVRDFLMEVKKELAKDISEEVLRLDKRLQELERRTNRILYELSQD